MTVLDALALATITDATPLVDAALVYAAAGFRVLPVWWIHPNGRCACGNRACNVDRSTGKLNRSPGKHPIENAWQNHATTDADAIREMWAKRPHANIGIAAGGDARIIVVDIDGDEGRASLDLIAQGRDLPETLESRSGRADGGSHYVFTVPESLDMARLGNRSSVNERTGIDTRVDGGQFVAAPSLHGSGIHYAWTTIAPIADLPEWLFEALASPLSTRSSSSTLILPPSSSSSARHAIPQAARSAPASSPASSTGTISPYLAAVIKNACEAIASKAEGGRNALLAAKSKTIFEYLDGAGLDYSHARDDLQRAGEACGMDRAEVANTIRKAEQNHGGPRAIPEATRTRPASVPSSTAVAGDASTSTSTATSSDFPPNHMLDFDHSKKGSPLRASLGNAVTFLTWGPWAGVLAYDEFGERVVKLRPPPVRPQDSPPGGVPVGDWTDDDTRRAVAWIASNTGKDFSVLLLEHAISVVAQTNVIHPVRDWLRSLAWDGNPRLDTMLFDCFGAEDTPYTRGVSSRWMISAVARVMRPGCQADCALVLEALQGEGKSTGLERLTGKAWFGNTGLELGAKDSYQCLRRKWIYELGELTGVKGRAIERVKAFLSSSVDNYRPSYARRNVDFPRQTIFAATTNESKYLTDPTGNRRFLPVRCVRPFDRDRIDADREQLWAEAAARFDAGEAWHVNTPEFRALCEAEQATRLEHDPWEEDIANWLANPRRAVFDGHGNKTVQRVDISAGVSTRDVLVYCLEKRVGDVTRADEMRVGESLRRLGWEPREFKVYEGESRKTIRRYLFSGSVSIKLDGTGSNGRGHDNANDNAE